MARKSIAQLVEPKTLDEFIGQDHLLDNNTGSIGNYVRLGYLPSMILYGPPGTGKTTLARLLANRLGYTMLEYSATDTAINELKIAQQTIQKQNLKRKYPLKVVIFVDEFHRFSVKQQDFLLSYIENGSFVFIGATSINLKSRIRRAIISRCQVFEMRSVSNADLITILKKASDLENNLRLTLHRKPISYSHGCFDIIANHSNGDIRSALKLLEYFNNHFANNDIIEASQISDIFNSQMVTDDNTPHNNSFLYSNLFKSLRGVYLDVNQIEEVVTKHEYFDYGSERDVFIDYLKTNEINEKDIEAHNVRQMQVSDDSDVESIVDGQFPIKWSKLKPFMFRRYHAMFQVGKLLQNGETPLKIGKKLLVFAAMDNSSHELITKLMSYIRAMKSANDPTTILEVCIGCILKANRKEKLNLNNLALQMKQLKQFLQPTLKKHIDPTISYDEDLIRHLSTVPEQEALSLNKHIEVQSFKEVEDYNIGIP